MKHIILACILMLMVPGAVLAADPVYQVKISSDGAYYNGEYGIVGTQSISASGDYTQLLDVEGAVPGDTIQVSFSKEGDSVEGDDGSSWMEPNYDSLEVAVLKDGKIIKSKSSDGPYATVSFMIMI
ncbi:MAG TPA: hypothetical protein VN372_08045 [Methanospirillum sp.]|nr:hypothetical protein [Methanospirillum sp.]